MVSYGKYKPTINWMQWTETYELRLERKLEQQQELTKNMSDK